MGPHQLWESEGGEGRGRPAFAGLCNETTGVGYIIQSTVVADVDTSHLHCDISIL